MFTRILRWPKPSGRKFSLGYLYIFQPRPFSLHRRSGQQVFQARELDFYGPTDVVLRRSL